MHKKEIKIIITILLFSILLLTSLYFLSKNLTNNNFNIKEIIFLKNKDNNKIDKNKNNKKEDIPELGVIFKELDEIENKENTIPNFRLNTEEKRKEIERIKKRHSVKDLIQKGDYYILNNQSQKALRTYLLSYIKITPKDPTIAVKIAETYFDLKNYSKAISFFQEAYKLDYKKLPRKYLLSILYIHTKESDIPKDIDLGFLTTLHINEKNINYTCRNKDLDLCIEGINSYSGKSLLIIDLKKALKTYEALGTGDNLYDNALIAGVFFKHKYYKTALIISENILKDKSDYYSAIKIAGVSNYYLGNIKNTFKYLSKYLENFPKDNEITYLLGVTFFQDKDYKVAINYLNKAVLNGYRPKEQLERYLVYSYYITGNIENMYQVFGYLLDEENVTVNDYSIAINIAWENNDLDQAELWVKRGLNKFKNSDILESLAGRVYNSKGADRYAITHLIKSIKINNKNILANFELGVFWIDKEKYNKAKKYLKVVIENDITEVFGNEALELMKNIKELERIQKIKEEQERILQEEKLGENIDKD